MSEQRGKYGSGSVSLKLAAMPVQAFHMISYKPHTASN
jgi:hypothetical protein